MLTIGSIGGEAGANQPKKPKYSQTAKEGLEHMVGNPCLICIQRQLLLPVLTVHRTLQILRKNNLKLIKKKTKNDKCLRKLLSSSAQMGAQIHNTCIKQIAQRNTQLRKVKRVLAVRQSHWLVTQADRMQELQ